MAQNYHVILFLSHFGFIYGLFTDYKNVIRDCNVPGNSIWKTTASSLSSCCSHCAQDRRCLSVSYRKLDGTCILHDVCPSACIGVGFEEPGWSLMCIGGSSSCLSIKRLNRNAPDGVYTIRPVGRDELQVFCDMTTVGEGWTVFQRRFDGSVDFYRDWNEHKTGFGNPQGEYWMGNDHLHEMTKQGSCKLRIELESLEGVVVNTHTLLLHLNRMDID